MRTISFTRHGVRRQAFSHTENFVRDKPLVYDQIVDLLVEVWHERARRKVQVYDRARCRKFLAKLDGELEGSSPALRILSVARWYAQHWGEKYTPVVDSGESFYRKFSRLEEIMRERTRQEEAPSVDEVVSRLFNGSRVVADAFRSDILVRASRLDFGGSTEGELARCLGDLYSAMRDERARHPAAIEDLPGLLDVLRRYIDWLGERDWCMTTRVLGVMSPSFQQFIREESSRHPFGLNPLTGR